MSVSNIKSVNIGDSGVGKTCVLISFTENQFPEDHNPTAFDNYTSIIDFEEKPITVNLWDTSGQESDTMRPLSYQDAKVFLMYFSVVDRKSFEHIESKWVPEVLAATKGNVPFIVVGNKIDLRANPEALQKMGVTKPVTTDEGKALAKRVGALHYTEVSAKTQENLGELFYAAVKAALTPEKMVPEAELKAMKAKKQGCKNQ